MVGTRSSNRRRAGLEETDKPSKATSRAMLASSERSRTKRQTRSGMAAGGTEVPSPTAKQVRAQSRSRGGGNIARRGARPSAETRSVASIATNVAPDSEYDESSGVDDSEEDTDEAIISQLEIPSYHNTLNADIMVKLRNNLYRAAQDLHGHFRLEKHDETWETLLGILTDAFNLLKAQYSTERTLFLDRGLIDKALADTPQAPPAVSHIVSAANLVILLNTIFKVVTHNEDAVRLLRELDEDFPQCIMAMESAISDSYDEHETFDRALDIRICHWILRIEANQALTEKAAIELGSPMLFTTSGGHVYPGQIDRKTIKLKPIYGVDFDNPGEEDQSESNMREDIFRAFENACQFLTGGEPGREVDLEGLQRAFPLEKCLRKLFGWALSLFGEVVKTIDQESARPTTNDQADAAELDSSMPLHKNRHSILGLANAQRGDQPTLARGATSRKRPRQEDVDERDVYGFNGEEDDLPTSPEHKKPKSRALAVRPAQGTRSTGTDRQAANDEPHSSGTAEERVARSIRSETPSQTSRKLQKRIRWDNSDVRKLKELVRIHGSFWARMEDVSKDEKRGLKFNVERSQQQMRDKARNMKVDMLRNDEILPEGFDNVVLGHKERKRVTDVGRNPDRKEKDVEDGRPVNTEYVAVGTEDEE